MIVVALAGVGSSGCLAIEPVESDTSELVDSAQRAAESAAAPDEARAIAPATGDGMALSVHTTLGVPEAAAVGDLRHYLLVKRQYVISFDSGRKNPRWTGWELTRAWMGSTPRSPSFKADPTLPLSVPQATSRDYTNSGWQRGHLCPSADRNKSVADNESTFVFTNVVPQTAESNTGAWGTLERAERTLADAGEHVYIVAGSIYADDQTIGAGVAVPTSMFKVVVVMSGARPTPADVTASTRVIAVEIPNTDAVSGDFRRYRTTFGALEAKTGFRFLSDVAPDVHDALARQTDTL
jgi:endonuclease G, mitochondrial